MTKKKILTADDSLMIRKIIRDSFYSYDCEVIEARDGVEALETIRREQPDLVILDVTMPGMSGVDVLENLNGDYQSNRPEVVMLTSETSIRTLNAADDMNVAAFIPKPFKPDKLINRVVEIMHLVESKELA